MPCHGTCHDCIDHYAVDDHELRDDAVPAQMAGTDPFSDAHAVPHFPPRLPLRPIHLTLDLGIDIADRRVEGVATHKVRAQMDGAASLRLNAEDFDSVAVSAAADAHLTFSYDGHVIDILLSQPLSRDDTIDLAVRFCVHPRDGMFFSGPGDGCFAVSDHETERARYWLPLVDHPEVRTTISFRLSTPAADKLTVLANGELVDETTEADTKVTRWEMKQLTPSYILCVAIGRFVRFDAGEYDGKPVAYFAAAGSRSQYEPEHLQLTFGRTLDMLRFMEKKTGVKLPWPKYYQWAVGDVSGAMENSSLVSYDEWYLQDARNTAERSHRVDSTVVHELAHTWFGDSVVCSDFCHSFLKESFATLISAEWYHFRNGADDAQHTLTTYAESAFAEAKDYMRPIVTRRYDSSWALFDRHLYTNGASRLNMLRHRLGNDRFWGAVSHYLQKRLWTTVETDDFRRDLEEATGEELVSFFDQWFYSKGHPVLDVSFSYDAAKRLAFVSVKQTQMDSRKGVSTFDLPVELELETEDGAFQTHTLHMTAAAPSAQLALALPAKPLQVVLDPGKKSLFALGRVSGLGDDLCARALAHGRTYAARHQAAVQLFDGGSRRGRAALRDAAASEKHWGLRVRLAGLLGESGRAEDVAVLRERLAAEPDARARVAVADAIAETRHASTGDVLLKFVAGAADDASVGYGVLASALRALGRWGGLAGRSETERAAVGKLLLEHIETFGAGTADGAPARGPEVATGAAAGVGLLHDWGTVEGVMALLHSDNGRRSERVRAGLVRCVGTAAAWEGRTRRMQAFAFVRGVLRGDNVGKGLRMACASTLVGLADAGAVGDVLDELERSVENQAKASVRVLRRRAARVAASRDGGGPRTWGSTMEKLQTEVGDLKLRLGEMQTKLDAATGAGAKAARTAACSGEAEEKSNGEADGTAR